MSRGRYFPSKREQPTKLIGLGFVGCNAALQYSGLRISPRDVVLVDTFENVDLKDVDPQTTVILVDDALARGLGAAESRSDFLISLRDSSVLLTAFSFDDDVLGAALAIARFGRDERIPSLAVVGVPTLAEGAPGALAQQRYLESLYESFDSVLVVATRFENLQESSERQFAEQQLLGSAIECITRNMMSADIAEAVLSRTFGGLANGQGKSSGEATASALEASQAEERPISSARMLLILVVSASQSPVGVEDAIAVATKHVDPSTELIGSTVSNLSLVDETRVTIVYLSARSDAFTSSHYASSTPIVARPFTLFNIKNDSRLRAKKIALATEYFDDEDEEQEPIADAIAFQQFVQVHPVGSRFEATVRRSTQRGVRVSIEDGFTGDVALDSNSHQVELTQIGQRLAATIETISMSRREVYIHFQRIDVPKLAVPIAPTSRRRQAFALSDFVVHPVDAGKIIQKVQGAIELDLVTFPLRISATIPLPGRIDDAFLEFMMETPPAPLRARFMHPQFDTHESSAFGLIGIFPSGAIRTVGLLKPTGGVAELHLHSLWHLLDPDNKEEDVHRNAARIAVDLVGVLY